MHSGALYNFLLVFCEDTLTTPHVNTDYPLPIYTSMPRAAIFVNSNRQSANPVNAPHEESLEFELSEEADEPDLHESGVSQRVPPQGSESMQLHIKKTAHMLEERTSRQVGQVHAKTMAATPSLDS